MENDERRKPATHAAAGRLFAGDVLIATRTAAPK